MPETDRRVPAPAGAPVSVLGGAGPRPGRRLAGAAARGARTVRADTALCTAVLVLAGLVLCAVAGPLVWPPDPSAVNLGAELQAPSLAHPMGTDGFGRDVLARFLRGAGISLAAGCAVVLAGAVCGGLLGIAAGLARGTVDAVLSWALNSILAFPPLILAMAVTVGMGVGVGQAVLGLTISSIPWYARILRSEVIRLRSLPHIEAATAMGARRRWIVRRHVIPHLLPTLFIQGTAAFGWAVLGLAALGFVGLGAQIPTPEWGAMITDGLQFALLGQWWVGVFPGLGLLVAVTATSVVADRARDLLDPRGSYARL